MNRPQRTQPAARVHPASTNVRRVVPILAMLAALIVGPVLVATGIAWFDTPRSRWASDRPPPRWVMPGEVRATTRDGTIVKLRVALDASTESNQAAVLRRLTQVALLLEVSVGSLTRSELVGAQGIVRLAAEMMRRVNDYLVAEGIAPLKAVAIQDLWYIQRQ